MKSCYILNVLSRCKFWKHILWFLCFSTPYMHMHIWKDRNIFWHGLDSSVWKSGKHSVSWKSMVSNMYLAENKSWTVVHLWNKGNIKKPKMKNVDSRMQYAIKPKLGNIEQISSTSRLGEHQPQLAYQLDFKSSVFKEYLLFSGWCVACQTVSSGQFNKRILSLEFVLMGIVSRWEKSNLYIDQTHRQRK